VFLLVLVFTQCQTADQLAFKQYQVQGERLYQQHCSNCHQPKGKGLARLYPPIAGSDYLQPNFEKIICGMKYGMEGEMVVNDIVFNQRMPGVLSLTDMEIAQIATYIFNMESMERGLVSPALVASILEKCP
jgi:mono/diheme cytochrome c family protein